MNRRRSQSATRVAATLSTLVLLASACGTDNVAVPQPAADSSEPASQPTVDSSEPVGDAEPGETVAGDAEPGETVAGDAEPGETVAGDSEAAESDPDEPCVSAPGSLTQAPALEPTRHAATVQLSNSPTIQWIEFDPGIGRVSGLTTVGDGRVLASPAESTTDSTGPNSTTTTVTATGTRVVTTDGVHWDELPLPEGIHPNIVNISSDPWLVTGRDRDEPRDSPDFPLEQVLISKDQGTTWTEVPVDSEPPVLHSVEDHLGVSSALVSDGRIVLSSEIYSRLDLGAVLADRGLISENQNAFFAAALDDDSLAAYVMTAEGLEVVEFTFEELSLTPDQRQLLERPFPLPDPGSWGVRVYSGDESGLEAVAEYEGYVGTALATTGGFVLHVRRPHGLNPRHLLIASPDGRSWSERSLDVEGENLIDVEAAGAGLTLWANNIRGAYSRIQILCHDGSPLRDVTLEGVILDGLVGVSVGPAGFVAVALPLHSFSSLFGAASFYGGATPRGSVTKDGYELRINEPYGVTLWDLDENREIFEGAPDGVRESGVGETFAAAFEDPDTGSDLVTFTWDDLSEVMGPANFPRGDTWVGWSVDGVDWEWQDEADVFGASVFGASVFGALGVAVGSDFLLAHVRGFRQEPSRWFMAKVPSV